MIMQTGLAKSVEIAHALFPKRDVHLRTFHTTFILRGKTVLAIGVNNRKTHPKNKHLPYINKHGINYAECAGTHSETSAIIKLGEGNCSNYTFVNVRINKQGNLAMSKPCTGCQSLLNQVGYKELYFTNTKGEFEKYTTHV